VNDRFDPLKKTLVNVRNARQTPNVEGEQPRMESNQVETTTTVPSGQTTLKISRKNGRVETLGVAASSPTIPEVPPPPTTGTRAMAAAHTAAPPSPPPPTTRVRPATAAHQAAGERSAAVAHHAADAATHPADHAAAPPPPEPTINPVNNEEIFPEEIELPYFEPEPETVPRNETATVLRVKATQPRPKKPKGIPLPDDMISMTFRLPRYMRDALVQICHDDGRDVAKVLRGLIKRHCQL
jgi:hypothetical protein